MIDKIAVRPHMYLDESFSSYILRLTYENGFKDVTSFLKYGGINISSTVGFDKSVKGNKKLIIDFLEIALNRSRDCIDVGIKYPDINDFNRSIKNLHLDFLRICPHCITEKKYIKQNWLLAPIAHCKVHNCLLIENCPHCKSKLDFKSNIFECCYKCGFKWSDYISNKEEITDVEHQVFNVLNCNIQNKFIIDDICAAICAIARPLDFIHPTIHTISHCENYSLIVRTVYYLLRNSDVINAWNEISNVDKSYLAILRDDLANFQLVNFKNKLKKIELNNNEKTNSCIDDSINLINFENLNFAKNARQKICSHVDDLRHQVTFKEISRILNLKSSEVSYLVGKHRLKSLNTSSIIRDQIYDIRELIQLINKYTVNSNAIVGDYIDLCCEDKVFSRYLTTFANLLGSIFDQSVSAFIKIKNREFSVLIKKPDLKRWLLKNVFELCKQPVAFSNARKLLRCSDLVLQQYIESKNLKLAKTISYRSNQMLDGTMLHDLFLSLDLPVR